MKALGVNFSDINQAMRLDSSYHLSEGTIYLKTLRKMPHKELDDITSSIFTAGRSKRVYTEEKYGYPYLSNSDVVKQNPLESCKYNSKKFGYDEASFLKEGMIVTGRVGAIGQTAYITSEFEDFEAMGSDNIIRIVPSTDENSGYLYAFLTSKFGNTLLWRLAAGGVQPYISEDMLRDMPIPTLSDSKQQEIHNLIVEASNLRVEANKLLREAEEKFHSLNEIKYQDSWTTMSENAIQTGFKVKKSDFFKTTIKARNHSLRATKIISYWNSKKGFVLNTRVSKDGLTRGMGGFFKRITDKNIKGMDIISQGDIHDKSPTFKQVIKKGIKESEVARKGMIIMPAAGTLGENEIFVKPQLIYKNFEGKVLSEVVGKIRPIDIENAAYIYVALKSIGGFRILRAMVYGTNLMYPNWELLKNLNIPCKNEQVMKIIANLVTDSYDKIALANNVENQAIDLVEKEIESWQK